MDFTPRSMLFVSGEKTERFGKAMAAGADLVCIDLEDAVHPQRKADARAQVLQWLAQNPATPQGPRRALRINGLRTRDGLRDLLALAESALPLDALLIPKLEFAAEVELVLAHLGAPGAPASSPIGGLVALVETAVGIENAAAIARSPVGALMLGGADLSAELGSAFDAQGLAYARGRLVNAARSAGRQVWDVPFIDVADAEGLAAETRAVLALGFDCKTAIHPQQIATIHSAFRPSASELEWAQALLAAMPADGASGAFLFNGRMVDAPVLKKARRTVQRAAMP